jgi:hypothetical protein
VSTPPGGVTPCFVEFKCGYGRGVTRSTPPDYCRSVTNREGPGQCPGPFCCYLYMLIIAVWMKLTGIEFALLNERDEGSGGLTRFFGQDSVI